MVHTMRKYNLISFIVITFILNIAIFSKLLFAQEKLGDEPIIANNSNLKDEHKTLLSNFLIQCDLVKFARYGPDEGEMKSAYESAKRFIDETVPAANQIEGTC